MSTQPDPPATNADADTGAGTDSIARHYSDGSARRRIEAALRAAGKDPEKLEAGDLALMEDFHSSGRFATAALIALAEVSGSDTVLDAGTGIGGTARLIAHDLGAQVSAIDLTPEYCEIARWLDGAVGLSEKIEVIEGDVLRLPFDAGSFDVVISQHVQMNIADKQRLYAEARRVLKPGGRLALWDVTAGPNQPIMFPVPWAGTPELSHLITPEQLREITDAAGFEVTAWNDLTRQSAEFMEMQLGGPRPPIGIQVLVPDIAEKEANFLANAREDRVRLIQAVLVAR